MDLDKQIQTKQYRSSAMTRSLEHLTGMPTHIKMKFVQQNASRPFHLPLHPSGKTPESGQLLGPFHRLAAYDTPKAASIHPPRPNQVSTSSTPSRPATSALNERTEHPSDQQPHHSYHHFSSEQAPMSNRHDCVTTHPTGNTSASAPPSTPSPTRQA